MKPKLLLPLALTVVLVGCSDSSNTSGGNCTNAPTSGSPVTAPVDYLNAAAKAKQSADKTIDVTSINKAIEMFNVQEGRYPTDLEELVTKKYMPAIPTPPVGSKLQYDAKAGSVKIVKE